MQFIVIVKQEFVIGLDMRYLLPFGKRGEDVRALRLLDNRYSYENRRSEITGIDSFFLETLKCNSNICLPFMLLKCIAGLCICAPFMHALFNHVFHLARRRGK